MQCPKCGYMLTDFDTECPRCVNLAAMPWVAPMDALHPRINARPRSRKPRSWPHKDLWIGGGAIVCILVSAVVIVLKIQGNDLNWQMHLNHIEARAKLQAERARVAAIQQAGKARGEAEQARVRSEQQRQEQESIHRRAEMRDLVLQYLQRAKGIEDRRRAIYEDQPARMKTPTLFLTQLQLIPGQFELMVTEVRAWMVPDPSRAFQEAFLTLLAAERDYFQAVAKAVRDESDLQRLQERIIAIEQEYERTIPALTEDGNRKLAQLRQEVGLPGAQAGEDIQRAAIR